MITYILYMPILFFVVFIPIYAADNKDIDDPCGEYYSMGNACAFWSAFMLPMTRAVKYNTVEGALIYSHLAIFTLGAGWAWYKGEQHKHRTQHIDEKRRDAILSTITGFTLGSLISRAVESRGITNGLNSLQKECA